jgi:hypothetical protein
MAKLFVLVVFSLALCGLTYHYFPVSASHAFNVGSVGVSWMACLFIGYLYAGHKLTGKK